MERRQPPASGGLEDDDDLNDETFGGGPVSNDWMPQHPQMELPDFFRDSQGGLLDGGLEPEGLETLNEEGLPADESLGGFDEEEIQYSTANRRFEAQDDFDYFIDDPQLDFQISNLTEDQDDDFDQAPYQSHRNTGIPVPTGNKDWLSYSRPGVASSPGDSIWGGSPSRNQMPPKQERPPQDNPLAKFFGGTIPTASVEPAQSPTGPRVSGVLSVEELEARLRNSRIAANQMQPQMSPQMQPHQQYGQPVAHQMMSPHQQQMPMHQQQMAPHQQQMPHHQQQIPQQVQPQYNQQQQKPQGVPYQLQQPQRGPRSPQVPHHGPVLAPDQFPALSRDPQPRHTETSQPVNILRNPQHYQHEGSPNARGFAASPTRQPFPRSPNPQFRLRWKEPKKMMSAYEIDSIIRMQEFQLLSGNNPFAEDFYFIMNNNKKKAQEEGVVPAVPHHKPLYESNTKVPAAPIRRLGVDPLEGVLGRIPSHSVRAPRPLLQLKQADSQEANAILAQDPSSDYSNNSSKAIQTLLLSIESAYQLVIDIEDIDLILRSSGDNATHFNINHIRQKREELTHELYRALHVFTIPINMLPQKITERDPDTNIFQEDEMFISWTLVHKGRKLIVRALPILYQDHVIEIFFLYMRNFGALISSPRIEMDLESTNKLFALLFNIVTACSPPHIILALQTILISHNEAYLMKILQSKFGLPIVQAILKGAHDFNLSAFGREDNVTAEMKNSPLGNAGLHWRDTVKNLMQRILGKWVYLFNTEIGRTNRIWEFFAVLVINVNMQEKQQLLSELREKIISTPMHATLSAFLQVAGLNPDLLAQQQQQQPPQRY